MTILRNFTKRLFNLAWRIFKIPIKKALFLISCIFCYFDFLNSYFFRNKVLITRNLKLDKKTSNKYLCIFSHFDPHNLIDAYVEIYLRSLTDANCDIIFVSTSDFLDEKEINKIRPYCKQIIVKQNRGYDFGSFKCGLLAAGALDNYLKVILANDSVYGPLYNIQTLLNYGDHHNLDIWGATDSWEKKYHIQSYFVIFSKSVIQHPSFYQFWKKLANIKYRKTAVEFYEVGMSQYFLKLGFKLGALCNYLQIKNELMAMKMDKYKFLAIHKNVNSSHFLWDVLIQKYGFPFIKKELLLKNPMGIAINHWDCLVQDCSDYDHEIISKHLLRLIQQ